MSAIKDGRYPIMLDKERHILFSLNVLDELQDRAGSYDGLGEFLLPDRKPNVKNIRWLLTILINEGKSEDEEDVTEAQVGRLIHVGNLEEVISGIFKTFRKGTVGDASPAEPDELEDDEFDDIDEEKNATSGRGQ